MKNNFQFKIDKNLIVPLSLAIILLIVVLSLSFLAFSGSKPPVTVNETPFIEEVVPEKVEVENIIPEQPLPLTPGSPYSFRVYFKERVVPRQVAFSLTVTGLYDDSPVQPVKIAVSSIDEKTLLVKTLEPIKDYGEYILRIKTTKDNQQIFSKGYMTNDVLPTPVPSNNPALLQFLPHETDSYILEYLPSRNIYVFHFKFNPDLPTSAESQFNAAQAAARQFIQSKGININSIVIEWRNS